LKPSHASPKIPPSGCPPWPPDQARTSPKVGDPTPRIGTRPARTTPALLGLYSFVALQADNLNRQQTLVAQSAAWYRKDKPTFSDALAAVRRRLLAEAALLISHSSANAEKVPRELFNRLANLACYAA
jgi:hypothetical protein